jgi:UDP-N-acetylglucosamine--N-acetylmuramyl-(pentapeptide) pyrophosphoryl-undecaprenol N-acetylglucosamine transferase
MTISATGVSAVQIPEIKIAVTGGGTGGHIFPNLSLIEELRKRGIRDIFWIGSKGGKEAEWAEKAGVPFHGVAAGKLRRYFSLRNAVDLLRIACGVFQSFLVLAKSKPDLLFSKGGFVSVPPVLAAKLLIPLRIFGVRRIPIITHESDIEPGLATRIIVPFADRVCVSFEKTKTLIPGSETVCTGNPVRGIVKEGDRKRGLEFLAFKQKLPTVLVLGGSLGASRLNAAVREMLSSGLRSFNVVHQCGSGNFDPAFPSGGRYRQFEFIDERIGDVLAAADLVVSRSGAGALCELGLMKKPSILVPLPKSKSRGEQIGNAKHFADNGAALVIEDGQLNGKELSLALHALLGDKKKLVEMGERARSLCVPDAEAKITDLIEEALGKKT